MGVRFFPSLVLAAKGIATAIHPITESKSGRAGLEFEESSDLLPRWLTALSKAQVDIRQGGVNGWAAVPNGQPTFVYVGPASELLGAPPAAQ